MRSKTTLYRLIYAVATQLFGVICAFWPRSLVTSVDIGQAMLNVARRESFQRERLHDHLIFISGTRGIASTNSSAFTMCAVAVLYFRKCGVWMCCS